MESFSAKLLSGSLIDSNNLIQRISDLGKIPDLQKMRDKQLKIHSSFKDKKNDDDMESISEESRMRVAAAWGGRRGSAQSGLVARGAGQTDREKIALDINILKKQYDKLRERQKQAHIILTTACTRQPTIKKYFIKI